MRELAKLAAPRARVRPLRRHRRARDRARRSTRSSRSATTCCRAASSARSSIIDAVARLVPGVLGEADLRRRRIVLAPACSSIRSTRARRARARTASAQVPRGASTGRATTPRSPRGAASRRSQRTAHAPARICSRAIAPTKADAQGVRRRSHARTHLALVHHPVVDRTGAVDHDRAHELRHPRSRALVDDVRARRAITSSRRSPRSATRPSTSRGCGCGDDAGRASRARAARWCAPRTSIETVIADARRPSTAQPPLVVATSRAARVVPGRAAPDAGRAGRRARARSRAAADPARDRLGPGRRADSVCISRAYADRRRVGLESSVGSIGRRGPPRPTVRSQSRLDERGRFSGRTLRPIGLFPGPCPMESP